MFLRRVLFRAPQVPCDQPVFRFSFEPVFRNHPLFHIGKMSSAIKDADFLFTFLSIPGPSLQSIFIAFRDDR